MRVELPRSSTEYIHQAAVQAVRRSGDARAFGLLGLLVLAAGYLPVILLAPAPASWSMIPWLLAPYVAVVGWIDAARRAEDRARQASWALAAAALSGIFAHGLWAYEMHVLPPRAMPLSAIAFLLPYLFLGAGAWLALSPQRSEQAPGLRADALIVLLAGTVAVLRLVVEPALASNEVVQGELAMLASLQLLGLVPLFLVSLLVLRRSSAFAPASSAALLGAAVAFAAGGMLSLAGLGPQQLTPGDPFDYLWLIGWILLSFAGFAARTTPATATDLLRDRAAYDGVRRMIVPVAALFLTAGVVDVALRPVVRPETVVVIALLGVVLSLRTAHALSLTDGEGDRRRQLAYTRALVNVTHALAQARDLDETLSVISHSARTVLGTRAAGIELVTDGGATLETRAAVGLPAHVLGLRFPVRGSFTGWVVQHGEARAAVDPSSDPYIQPQSLHFLGRSPLAAAPIRFRGETTGALYACIRNEPFDAEDLAFLGAMAEQAAIAIERARLFDQVSRLSVTDPLTGLANRRSLEKELEREFAAARRGRRLAAVLFDLDDFKAYNDTYGHLAGDEVLEAFGRILGEETRTMNLAARYGGDEFVALLGEAGLEGARGVISRVRERFDEAVRALGRGTVGLSAGAATFDPAMAAPEDLLRAADQDMYRQKVAART